MLTRQTAREWWGARQYNETRQSRVNRHPVKTFQLALSWNSHTNSRVSLREFFFHLVQYFTKIYRIKPSLDSSDGNCKVAVIFSHAYGTGNSVNFLETLYRAILTSITESNMAINLHHHWRSRALFRFFRSTIHKICNFPVIPDTKLYKNNNNTLVNSR